MAGTKTLTGNEKTAPLWKKLKPDFLAHQGDKWLRKYKTPDHIWKAACEYFQWCDDNPIYMNEKASFQGDITVKSAPHRRAYSVNALCPFIDITKSQLYNLRDRYDARKADPENYLGEEDIAGFRPVIERILAIIEVQKFEGAAVGEFNPNFIARDLGLGETIDHTSSDGSQKQVTKIELVAATDEDRDTPDDSSEG